MQSVWQCALNGLRIQFFSHGKYFKLKQYIGDIEHILAHSVENI